LRRHQWSERKAVQEASALLSCSCRHAVSVLESSSYHTLRSFRYHLVRHAVRYEPCRIGNTSHSQMSNRGLDPGLAAHRAFASLPFMVCVASLLAKCTSASYPLMFYVASLAANQTILTVFSPVVLFVASLATYRTAASSPLMVCVASLTAVVLLFTLGLEFNIKDILKFQYFIIALVSIIIPAFSGFFLGRLFNFDFKASIFIGTALTATSIAITANVLKEIGKLQTATAKAVIGAAVIDDVLVLL
jgi:hypothetical protein